MTENPASTFNDLVADNPCNGCPAPCCRMQIFPSIPPKDVMSLDHIRYSLHFPGTELNISRNGDFSLIKWTDCTAFDTNTCGCKLHNTPKKPLTCVHYNPHNCWYKRNFVTSSPPDVCRLNLERFEVWVTHVKFEGNETTFIPNFESTMELIKEIPITPTLSMSPKLVKDHPLALVED